MDKSWMLKDRLSDEYEDGVAEFLRFSRNNGINTNMMFCPCMKCGNLNKMREGEVKDHLICNGIDQSYKKWIWHGEISGGVDRASSYTSRNEYLSDEAEDQLREMIHDDAQEDGGEHPADTVKLLEDSEKPMSKGSKLTKLSFLVRIFNSKARNGLSDKGFTDILDCMGDAFPEYSANIPKTAYECKKMLRTLGMGYEKIHACPQDCILYRDEFAEAASCPKCKTSRWKTRKNYVEIFKEGVPAKVLWYIPPIPRFNRLFGNPKHAKSLLWHDEERIKDGKLRHPADSPAWQKVDEMWPVIKEDARNLRLGLSADGINPHSSQSSNYSCWPVILVIYNLPPWLTMKRRFTMLTLLISGPKQPGNDIDVYLRPLINDLNRLWLGVPCFDGLTESRFTLRAVLLWTINDFPALGNLSGHCVKGYYACPECSEETDATRLCHCKKIVYMGHRRLLPHTHAYRRYRHKFNGKQEFRSAPKILTGEDVYEKVSLLSHNFGKKVRPLAPKGKKMKTRSRKTVNRVREASAETDKCWKKKSIFFELPYWPHLLIRHNLDVMHIEKNVCESIIGTLLNIPGKTKDGLNARLDLADMGIRPELAPVVGEKRTVLPAACITLGKDEKQQICESLANMKVPIGYCSNIRNLVSLKDRRLLGLKSHDYHALMQQLLPIAIRGMSQKHVRCVITRLCMFFNRICQKTVDVASLESLQEEIVKTLCLLEQYFPPSFFDIMVHLTVHLVKQVELGGPVCNRWMYGFERMMKIYKGSVRNRNRPEGCIVESYIAEEAVEFCSDYVRGADTIGVPKRQHDSDGGSGAGKCITMHAKDINLAHRNVLENTEVVQKYIRDHLDCLKRENPRNGDKWIQDEHHKTFARWLKDKVEYDIENKICDVSEELKWIARRPTNMPITYETYNVNGRRFSTKSHDDKRVNQNSGVSIVAQTMQVSSAKDKHPLYGDMTYYGVIQEIWDLDYCAFRVPVFKCDWVDQGGVSHDEFGFISVNLSRLGYKGEPFIMASQAKQVFYVEDPVNKQLSVVLSSNPRWVYTDSFDEVEEIEELSIPQEMDNYSDGFDSISAIEGAYHRDDVRGHVIKHKKAKNPKH